MTQKQLHELRSASVISEETEAAIRAYYLAKSGASHNRLFVVFGILGALLVGLGIILIIAHNWDEFPRAVKVGFAFLPMLAGQGLCGYTLWKQDDSLAWRESSATLLVFAIGAAISLVSQIYHIPGNLASFVFVWSLLALPLVYLMRSSFASLLYIIGITYYAAETGYWSYPSEGQHWYWLLLALIVPHYYWLIKNKPDSNFTVFHHRFVPLSLAISLGILGTNKEEFLFVGYMSLFGLFYLIGNHKIFDGKPINGYTIIGSLGSICALLPLSFDWFWVGFDKQKFIFPEVLGSVECLVSIVLTIITTIFLILQRKGKPISEINPVEPVFLLFAVTFCIGLINAYAAIVLVNLIVFIVGVLTIRKGAKLDHLGVLNYGLLIITALITCRFFDTNMTFVMRGLLFVTVGAGFIIANSKMLKKRNANAN